MFSVESVEFQHRMEMHTTENWPWKTGIGRQVTDGYLAVVTSVSQRTGRRHFLWCNNNNNNKNHQNESLRPPVKMNTTVQAPFIRALNATLMISATSHLHRLCNRSTLPDDRWWLARPFISRALPGDDYRASLSRCWFHPFTFCCRFPSYFILFLKFLLLQLLQLLLLNVLCSHCSSVSHSLMEVVCRAMVSSPQRFSFFLPP